MGADTRLPTIWTGLPVGNGTTIYTNVSACARHGVQCNKTYRGGRCRGQWHEAAFCRHCCCSVEIDCGCRYALIAMSVLNPDLRTILTVSNVIPVATDEQKDDISDRSRPWIEAGVATGKIIPLSAN